MILYPELRQCPHCEGIFEYTRLMSYSQFGDSVVWSDGFNESRNAYFEFPFTICPHCKRLAWILQSPPVKIPENDNFPAAVYPPPEYGPNSNLKVLRDAEKLLKEKNSNPEKLLILYITIWRCINNEYRAFVSARKHFILKEAAKKYQAVRKLKKKKQTYVRRLLNLLKDLQLSNHPICGEDDFFPMRVELLRQAGKFPEARELLNKAPDTLLAEHKTFVKLTRRALFLRRKQLFKTDD